MIIFFMSLLWCHEDPDSPPLWGYDAYCNNVFQEIEILDDTVSKEKLVSLNLIVMEEGGMFFITSNLFILSL